MEVIKREYLVTEIKVGGMLLSIGAFITIVCILLEVNAGWASLFVEMNRSDYEAGIFLFENWQEMRSIWTWALIGNVFLAIAALILLKKEDSIASFPMSVLWSIYFIGSLLLIISFGICLGSYYPALEVIEEHPAIFLSTRGAPLYLFYVGMISGLIPLIIYFYEGFRKQGIVPRRWAIIMSGLLLIVFIAVSAGIVSFAVFAITCFLITILLGIFYWRIQQI